VFALMVFGFLGSAKGAPEVHADVDGKICAANES
jgi:hypothetical protein